MIELALPEGWGESSSTPSTSEHWRLCRRPRPQHQERVRDELRALAGFLRARYGEASVEMFTVGAVAAWRDHLQAQGLAPSSVAQRVSAVRRLAAAVGADPLVAQVRCTQVQQERPSALSDLSVAAQTE